jgi:hypothetical protein
VQYLGFAQQFRLVGLHQCDQFAALLYGKIVLYKMEHTMPMPTFDEVLASVRQLPVADQLRLRDTLPVRPAEQQPVQASTDAADGSPFSTLAGMIDEPPQSLLSPEDQEVYGR